MAVQAHHPSSVGLLAADFCNRGGSNVDEELHFFLLQFQRESEMFGWNCSNHDVNGLVKIEPQSELTCTASRTRKRPAPDQSSSLPHPLLQSNPVPSYLNTFAAASGIPFNSASCFQQTQLLPPGSTSTSTSGRPVTPPISPMLISHLLQRNAEIDNLVRIQSERLGCGLRELWKRQCVELLQTVEQRAEKRLREKEEELEKTGERIAELEQKLREANSELQMWFGIAKNNEAAVTTLQASLEEVLRNAGAAALPDEGYGENDDCVQSCFTPSPLLCHRRKGAPACKACQEADACVLLIPCRHLCLCKECSSKTDTCPICHLVKNTSLEVVIPAP
ncbi:putative BOI-related E3 ubiquitin-protein ligase 2 [Canna indica]|uniref:BOI-related E3 ubiquitin-protein ligase 2 n=1 Tax=Canna indica TaxID=4628 RepID=A0AAQ3QK82_9LILI|nr:putative BOI-related E3 ubiquitin-protein ligase 2 [Canna indica]